MQAKLIFLILLFWGMWCSSIYAQSLSSLKSENKQTMKELKVKYGLSSIKIEMGDNGFWYYLVSQKKGNQKCYGVISKNGNFIFECEYEDIIYINGIYKDGYVNYTFNSMSGGTDEFKLYNHMMLDHFILEKADTHEKLICTCDGKILKSGIQGQITYLGSWLLINTKEIYTRQLDGVLKLIIVNNESKNMRFMTWNGIEIFNDEMFLMIIANKASGNFNNVFAFNNQNRMGAIYLEDLNSIVPIEYSEIRTISGKREFEVKLHPADKFHVYNKTMNEKFIPKNPGEQFYVERKYEDCIKYYATEGVADADSKLYSASALKTIAILKVIQLQNHVQAPSANQLKDYNYNEIKSLLNDAKTILESAMSQDTLRTKVYQENINNCDVYLDLLETYHAQLKENSFGNQLLKSILAGISEGLKQAAVKSINASSLNIGKNSHSTANDDGRHNSSTSNSTGSSNSSNSGGLSDGVQNRIRQVEKNIANETEYLQHAQKRYNSNPTSAGKREIEAHKRAIEGYRKQIEDLKSGR